MPRRVLVLMSALVLVAACSGGDDAAPASTTAVVSTTGAAATTTRPATPTTTLPASPTTVPATTTTPPAGPTSTLSGTTTSIAAPTTTVPTGTVDVKVYLLRGERLVIAHRRVTGPAVLRGALAALLEGPTDAERAAGLTSTVPAGTGLRDVTLAGGLATVDLTTAYGTGGGSLSMQARVAEVVFTATQFPTVERVAFRIDGVPVTALGGEGLVLTEPQARLDVPRSFTGGVLVDTPVPGTTVGRTFTVTGEGDVYEAQFGIEVWAGGRLVGGVAPVTAGAWGTWRAFRATITLPDDVPAGPIELVTYDAGGCGTDPECPPIVTTVVALALAPRA